MRIIDADALKEKVLKWLPPDPHGMEEKEFPFQTDICVSMLQEIEEAPTIEQPHWIPCSEKLPEKAYGRYWVCTDTGYQCQCRWTDDVYGLGSNGEWEWKIFDIPQYSHVVAWMPLPEPARLEGE